MKPIVSLLATALLLGWTAFADTIAEWNFNNAAAQTTPSAGAGTLGPIGGITVSPPASGVGSSDPEAAAGADNAYQTTSYPAAAVGDRTAGIEVAASTVGYKNVTVRFDYRGSNTSSRKLAVLYSLDGATFLEGVVAEILTGGAFTNGITLDLTAVPGANENPNFKVRIVSTFADGAAYAAISGNYGTAGTARFDMVTVAGEPSSSEPRPPVIFTQPVDRTAFVGSTATFSVVAGGSAPLAYFWEKDKQDGLGTWDLVEGGTGATLSLANVQFAQAGTYRVTVSNALDVVRSMPAQLTVQEDPANVVSTIAQLRAKVDPATLVPTDTTTVYKAEGIVTTHVNITTAGNHFFYIQDATGAIGVFVSGATGEVPPAGALVRVTGPLTHFNGLLELGLAGANTAHKVEILSTGNPLPTPTPLNFAWPTGVAAADDPNVLDAEANEAKLVVASNVLIDSSTGPTFAGGSNVIITDAADPTKTFTLRVDSRVIDIIGQQKPTGPATIIGVLGQFDGSDPRAGGYQLLPTRFADIESAFKAATIRFTNTLSNLVRPGDQPVNTFAEHALRPGESISIGFEITDPENRPVTVTLGNAIPAGAEWSFGSLSGTKVNGTFRYTATAAAGQAFDVAVTADNGSTSFTQTIRLYVPTVAEQQVVITEFYANPASTNAVAWFNPLNRAELLPGGNDASPANRDEFVELVNLSGESIDLTGWMVSDALLRRAYIYPGTAGTTLAPSNSLIVYGGPAFGFAPQLSVPAIAAEVGPGDAFSTAGLALNDGGDTIILRNAQSNIISRVLYAQSQTSTNGSLVRFPTDRDGFVAHSGTGARYWSPGTQADGKAWTEAQPNADVAPAIVTPPVSVTVAAGIPATFSVVATGVPAPTYRWQRDGVGELPGETAASYTLASPQVTDDGASFRVIIANRAGSITSAPVTLTVTAPPPEIIRTNIAYLRTQVDPVNLRPANTTQLYEVEAIVNTHVNLTGSANTFFYCQDDTAGIGVFVTGKPGAEVPPAGARVRIVGPLGHFNGLLQFSLSATNTKHVVEVLSTGNPLPAPVALDFAWPITTTDLTATSPGIASAEANEGRLVRVDNVLLDAAAANFTSGSNVTVTDAADSAKTFVLRIDSRVTEIIGQPKPTEAVSLVGVLGQFDNADPRAGGYQLIVTRLADIIAGSVAGPITATAAVAGETVTLTWNGTPGATYSVLGATNAAGPFSAVVTGLTSPTHSASTAGQTGGFFRITSP